MKIKSTILLCGLALILGADTVPAQKKRARPEVQLYRGLQDLQSGRKVSKREEL